MTGLPGPHAETQAAPHQPHWRAHVPQVTKAYVVARDMVLQWDRSAIPVRRGTVVHVQIGSELWEAYGGEDGLRPLHGGQARLADGDQVRAG